MILNVSATKRAINNGISWRIFRIRPRFPMFIIIQMCLVNTWTCIFVVDMLYMLLLYHFFYRFSIRHWIPNISIGNIYSGNCGVCFLVCNANKVILRLLKKTDKIKKIRKKLNTKKTREKKCIIQQKKLTPSKLTEPQKPIPEKAKITKTT